MKDGGNLYYFPAILKNLGVFPAKLLRENIFPRNDLVEGQNFSDPQKFLRGGAACWERVIGVNWCINLNTRMKFSRSLSARFIRAHKPVELNVEIKKL